MKFYFRDDNKILENKINDSMKGKGDTYEKLENPCIVSPEKLVFYCGDKVFIQKNELVDQSQLRNNKIFLP